MRSEEKKQLQTIVLSLSEPSGNWTYAWKILCEMAGMNPKHHQAHFGPHPILDAGKKLSNLPVQTD